MPTLFSESATCDDTFFKMFDDPEALLTGENGSIFIVVSEGGKGFADPVRENGAGHIEACAGRILLHPES